MPNYYAVDGFTQMGDTMRFFLGADLVYMCRAREGQWAVLNRKAAGTVTEKELILDAKKDSEAEQKFYKELDPEAYKKAEELINSGLLDQMGEPGGRRVVMLGGGEDGQPTKKRTPEEEERLKTGQYL